MEFQVASLTSNETRDHDLQSKIMDWLEDQRIGRIGVWGRSCVGKTTLLKNLYNSVKQDNLFDVVIWVSVFKDLNLNFIQKQIADSLDVWLTLDEGCEETALKLLNRLSRAESFLVIMDGLCEKLDLEKLGIPRMDSNHGSKIIFSSRSFDVCKEMMVDEEIRIDVLSEMQAWSLFSSHVGEVIDSHEIRTHAKEVAKMCHGLPLALVTVGRAMRGKTGVEQWKQTLSELQQLSGFDIQGIDEVPFAPLKWCYEQLQGNHIKLCFLYCSLFPQDFSVYIYDLISYWRVEGYINMSNFEESSNNGIAIIETLKSLRLLEKGEYAESVKMSRVLRDMALWITSESDICHGKFIVQAGMGMREWPEVEACERITKISLMDDSIKRLPEKELECYQVVSLMLQGNPLNDNIVDSFFKSMSNLRLLDLSHTKIKRLPESVSGLVHLRALYLCGCQNLEKLPSLDAAKELEILDLYGTKIRELPLGMEELIQLKVLVLPEEMTDIQYGVMSRFGRLEELDMHSCRYYIWGLSNMGGEEKSRATLEELTSLGNLSCLAITIENLQCLTEERICNLLSGLTRFFLCIGRNFGSRAWEMNPKYFWSGTVKKRLFISGIDEFSPNKGFDAILVHTETLGMVRCRGIKSLSELNTRNMVVLKLLYIFQCHEMENLISGENVKTEILCSLEVLMLSYLTKLERLWEGLMPHGSFRNLKVINIKLCENLRIFLSYCHIQNLKNLEVIYLCNCPDLEEIIIGNERLDDSALPNLKTLLLFSLNKLKRICRGVLPSPLQTIRVSGCPLLKTLPLDHRHAGTMKEIQGDKGWWEDLEWEEGATKSMMEPFFQDTSLSIGTLIAGPAPPLSRYQFNEKRHDWKIKFM